MGKISHKNDLIQSPPLVESRAFNDCLKLINYYIIKKSQKEVILSFFLLIQLRCGARTVNSRCRSLRSLVAQCLRCQFALSFAPLTRTANNKYVRAALVNIPIVKSFAQAFSKACGFQRQSLWRCGARTVNSRCRSLRSLVLQEISTFARNNLMYPYLKVSLKVRCLR